MSGQRYDSWFVDYPSTHERAGESVEVVPRRTLSSARVKPYVLLQAVWVAVALFAAWWQALGGPQVLTAIYVSALVYLIASVNDHKADR